MAFALSSWVSTWEVAAVEAAGAAWRERLRVSTIPAVACASERPPPSRALS